MIERFIAQKECALHFAILTHSILRRFGIEGVAEAITEKVEGEESEREKQGGVEEDERLSFEEKRAFFDEDSPR